MEKEKTIYCGSGKKQNDTWIKATINAAKIKDHIEEYNGNKFVRLNINVKDQPDQYGKDVSISVDKWKPEPQNNEPTEVEGDLPF